MRTVERAQHLRCRRCEKRFKGRAGVTSCPVCGRPAKADKWANRKPWRQVLCYCDAYPWDGGHRLGGGLCQGGSAAPITGPPSSPDDEYPF